MSKRGSYRLVLTLGAVLLLLPVKARADFVIEFNDGHTVTVRQYVEEGEMIKIYTSQGAIGFRKMDVKQITQVRAGSSIATPLETVSSRTPQLEQPSAPTLPAEEKKAGGGQDVKGEKKNQDQPENVTEAKRERLGEQYQDAAQQMDAIWQKHMQDVESGAADDVLAENRRRMDELNLKRHELIKEERRITPDDLPSWAQ